MDSRFANPGDVGHFLHYGGAGGPYSLASDFVIVDVETSGLDPASGARVVEIAAVRVNQAGDEVGQMSSLVNPGDGETGATWIHGISPEMVSAAPSFSQIFDQFAALLDNAIFVAHHAKFDEGFVAAEARIAGMNLEVMPGLCTYWLARSSVRGTANLKLGTLAEHFGITQHGAHSALDDARVVSKMLPKMLASVDPITFYSNEVTQPRNGNISPAFPRL
jgi:DNA polymerase-3 subunit epsilon